jgi:hypothetical protein
MIPVQPAVIEIQNLYYGYYEYGIKNGLKNAHLYALTFVATLNPQDSTKQERHWHALAYGTGATAWLHFHRLDPLGY